jgi:hypothetical protein
VDATKNSTITGSVKANCKLTAATGSQTADVVTCTTIDAIIAAGATTLTLGAGAVTAGSPQGASTFQVHTTTMAPATTPGNNNVPATASKSQSSASSVVGASYLALAAMLILLRCAMSSEFDSAR